MEVSELCREIALLPPALQTQVETFIAFQLWKQSRDDSQNKSASPSYEYLEGRIFLAAEPDAENDDYKNEK